MKDFASVTYTDSRGNVYDLMVLDLMRITTANFHEYSWTPEASDRRFGERFRAWQKDALKLPITLVVQGTDNERAVMLNALHDSFEYDIAQALPGVLAWEEYSIECYAISSKTYPLQRTELHEATANEITLYCPNPFWRKTIDYQQFSEESTNFKKVWIVPGRQAYTEDWLTEEEGGQPLVPEYGYVYDIQTEGEYYRHLVIWVDTEYYDITAKDWDKDYEEGFDYAPHDYMANLDLNHAGIITNTNILGSKYIATIYGPCNAPYVSIRNRRSLTEVVISFPAINVPPGAKLVVNSLNKTAKMYTAEWDEEHQRFYTVDCFGARDPDYYLWDTIGPGVSLVDINEFFRLDLEIIEERSEPKWRTG